MPDEPRPAGLREAVARRGSFARSFRAVGWSFFGVRRSSELERDAQELNPVHVIIAGVLAAVLFVVALVMLAGWVISSGIAR